jgi:stress-induced-phosphoprotein 1
MAKIKMVQQNPNLLQTVMSDPKMMEMLSLMLGGGMEDEEESSSASTSASSPYKKAKEEQKTPDSMQVDEEEVEEDWSNLSPEDRTKKETEKNARLKKEAGNELYRAKKFEEALAAYDEAVTIDPTNMTFLSNKAAVYFTQKKYDQCIEECLKAIEVGKEYKASFDDRAKAMTRCAKAYQKIGDLAKAIEMCQSSQLESYSNDTQRLLKSLELEKKKKDALDYQDDVKAEEAKQRGNEYFRQKEYAKAVADYEEAVKRSPKDPAIRNNLSAALTKILDFNGAKTQVEKALELDPNYVKAWARKGDIEFAFKEYHKAMDSYKHGLNLEPDNVACKQGIQKTQIQMTVGRATMTEEQKQDQAAHAMADPEIQSILQDPVVQQVLRDFSENPTAAQQAMRDAGMRGKIERLIASGLIETR